VETEIGGRSCLVLSCEVEISVNCGVWLGTCHVICVACSPAYYITRWFSFAPNDFNRDVFKRSNPKALCRHSSMADHITVHSKALPRLVGK